MDTVQAYLSLSAQDKASPTTGAPLLAVLLNALSTPGRPEPAAEVRRQLVSSLLSTLSCEDGATHDSSLSPTSSPAILLPTLALLKFLGRSPAGSQELGRDAGIRTLLRFGGLSRVSALPVVHSTAVEDQDEGDDAELEEEEQDPFLPHESEALRCLSNTLMLHPSARELFPTVFMEDRSWMRGAVRVLGSQGAGFLAGRLLFLLSSKPGDAIAALVENGETVKAMAKFATRYLAVLQSPSSPSLHAGLPSTTDTLREHLKLSYNMTLQYSRLPPTAAVTGSSDEGEEVYDSDARTEGNESRSTSPVCVLGGEAVEKERRKAFWKGRSGKDKERRNSSGHGSSDEQRTSQSRSSSPARFARRIKKAVTGSSSSSSTPPPLPKKVLPHAEESQADGGELKLAAARTHFLPIFRPYLHLAVLLPFGPDSKSPDPLMLSALNSLLIFPLALEELDGYSHSWLQPVPNARTIGHLAPLPSRAIELLRRTCDAWFPTDVVPVGARGKAPVNPDELLQRGLGESARVEEILGPLMLLLRKLSMLSEPQGQLKQYLLPSNLDRTIPLDRRPDLIGHLVRLLSSIVLPNTAYGVGEFLYNLADRDPTTLCTMIGYGNASGFLQNRGQLIPPPPISIPSPSSPTSTREEERYVNPITGAYDLPSDSSVPEMTEEEKQAEAEKLYVLFDRMASTGVMEVENPIRAAQSQGKFVETTEEREEELRREREEEEEEERQVGRELEAYRNRKKGGAIE